MIDPVWWNIRRICIYTPVLVCHDQITVKAYMYVEFWVLVAVLVIWFGLYGVLLYAVETKNFAVVRKIPEAELLVSVLGSALALTISEKCLQWLDCSFYDDGSRATMDIDVNEYFSCWEGEHWGIGVFCLTALYLYQVMFYMHTQTHEIVVFFVCRLFV